MIYRFVRDLYLNGTRYPAGEPFIVDNVESKDDINQLCQQAIKDGLLAGSETPATPKKKKNTTE